MRNVTRVTSHGGQNNCATSESVFNTCVCVCVVEPQELKDVSAYSALKGQIYGFQQAAKRSDARFSVHHVRCVLLLLLAHQFDVQLQREEVYPEQLHKEFQFFNEVLRENWIRATESTDLDFGCSLDSGPPESGGQERTFITSQP